MKRNRSIRYMADAQAEAQAAPEPAPAPAALNTVTPEPAAPEPVAPEPVAAPVSRVVGGVRTA
jgi:hypothetical protein